VDLAAGLEQGPEEAKTLDVVHVQVRQEDVHGPSVPGVREPRLPHAGSRVEQEDFIMIGLDLDARGVAAIPPGLGACARDRTARSPDREPHAGTGEAGDASGDLNQSTTSAPRTRPLALSSGTAVASTGLRTPSKPWM